MPSDPDGLFQLSLTRFAECSGHEGHALAKQIKMVAGARNHLDLLLNATDLN